MQSISGSSGPKSIGDFEIIRELGRGGMGVVFEAHQKSLNRRVALKVLSGGLGLTTKAVMRFRREAEAAAKLHHTNIVPIYSTGDESGVHYYSMELVNGPSLDKVIRRMREGGSTAVPGGDKNEKESESPPEELPNWVAETIAYEKPSTETGIPADLCSAASADGSISASAAQYFDTVAKMMAEAADALQHAHDHGVIHRDVKPANLLLAADGHLSINDFGLARVLEQPSMTMSGEFVGTPAYMSPEQITAGRAPLDHRTDIYSLGATLYEMLTLQPPFLGKSRDEVIGQILHKEPKPPRSVNKRIPKDLETICLKAIERDPDRRYQTAGVLANDLRAYLNRRTIQARRVGWIGKSMKWTARNKPLVGVTATLMFVLITLLVLWARDSSIRRQQLISSLESEFLLQLFSHDSDEAQRTLDELEATGADSELLTLLRASFKLQRADLSSYRDAIDDLEACQNIPGYRIAGKSMLAAAYMHAGDEAEYYRRVAKLNDEVPESWEDRVYKGYAQIWGAPLLAVENLEKATSVRTTPETEVMLARALHAVALDEPDPNAALPLVKSARNRVEPYAMRRGHRSARRVLWQTHLTAGRLHEELGDVNSADLHLSAAKEATNDLADMLRSGPSPNLLFEVCVSYDVLDMLPEALSLFERDLNSDTSQLSSYSIARLALAYYREGKVDKARSVCGDVKDLDAPMQSPIRMVKAFVDADAFTNNADARAYLDAYMARYRKRPRVGLQLMHDCYAALILGGKDEAIEIANDLAILHDHPWRQVNEYCRNPKDSERLLNETKHSRRIRTYSRFAIALNSLAEGDYEMARPHLEQCEGDGYYFWWAYAISKAILQRMDSEPNGAWPPWMHSMSTK